MRQTLTNIGLLILRVLAGTGIAVHGYGKVFGGGVAWVIEDAGRMGFPLPFLFGWAAALSEFLGGILIVLGLGTRIGAFFVFNTMSVAAFIHHKADPFKDRELALAYWTIALALMFIGPGRMSLDRILKYEKS